MPVYHTPKRFPGVEKLPKLVQTLLESYFPPDEVMPAVGGVRMGSEAVKRALGARPPQMNIKPTVEALKPLGRSIDAVKPVVKDVVEDAAWPPQGFLTADPASQEMVHLLRKLPDVDMSKMVAGSRVTGKRPPMKTDIKAPEGFYFGSKQIYGRTPTIREGRAAISPTRDPLVEEMAKRYGSFDTIQKKLRQFSRGGKP